FITGVSRTPAAGVTQASRTTQSPSKISSTVSGHMLCVAAVRLFTTSGHLPSAEEPSVACDRARSHASRASRASGSPKEPDRRSLHRRLGRAGDDLEGVDSGASELLPERLGRVREGRLRGRVMSRVGDAGNLNHGGDVDDEPLTALPHGRNQALDESERAPEI